MITAPYHCPDFTIANALHLAGMLNTSNDMHQVAVAIGKQLSNRPAREAKGRTTNGQQRDAQNATLRQG